MLAAGFLTEVIVDGHPDKAKRRRKAHLLTTENHMKMSRIAPWAAGAEISFSQMRLKNQGYAQSQEYQSDGQ